MKTVKNPFFFLLLALSFLLGTAYVVASIQGEQLSHQTNSTWSLAFIITTILWARFDADRFDFVKPFDFGFFIYISWPVAFPWYLLKTRGAKGIISIIGFLTLWIGPWTVGDIVYLLYYD